MTSTTQTNFDPALKQIYRDSNVQKTTYTQRPAFGLLPKYEGFGGRNMPVVNLYGNPQGRSAVFATAQSNRTQVRVEDFLLTHVTNYSVATVDGLVIVTTKGDNYAFLAALKTAIDGAMAQLADDIEADLFRTGEGWKTQVTTLSSADPMVLTLTQTEEITNYEVGMTLVADNNSTGASLRSTPATAVINSIDRGAGTITTGYDNSGGTTDWAASDYLFIQGDQAGGAGTANFVKIAGFDAWVPSSAPGSTAFFGVDRSTDSSRLGGLRVTGTLDTLEDASINAQSTAAREGGVPDCLLLHHAQVRRFIKELGAKKDYTETQAVGPKGMLANIGYRSLVIQGDHGTINVVAAAKCQAAVGWMLQKNTWVLASAGPPVQFLQEDNLRILRQASADGYEVRLGFYGNLGCKAPGWNVRISLPSP